MSADYGLAGLWRNTQESIKEDFAVFAVSKVCCVKGPGQQDGVPCLRLFRGGGSPEPHPARNSYSA